MLEKKILRDSIPRPFNHESDALTTELSPLPCTETDMQRNSDRPTCEVERGGGRERQTDRLRERERGRERERERERE